MIIFTINTTTIFQSKTALGFSPKDKKWILTLNKNGLQ